MFTLLESATSTLPTSYYRMFTLLESATQRLQSENFEGMDTAYLFRNISTLYSNPATFCFQTNRFALGN
ncbi:hypothetical protein DCAR_0205377 [Daucus carota subsp. sativus]|uniref:Uncharacterized protein n=1 Tax=Daucus carota subsp. sativus TaxID=79200 RepID=A0A161WZ81_DAUCS|nr:hypothetical protein DCAR_0205377 [Daucus carota subsp. sativus]